MVDQCIEWCTSMSPQKKKSPSQNLSKVIADTCFDSLGVICMWVCPCRTNIEFHFLCWSSEMSEEYSVEKARKMERELEPAQWQWALSCLLQRGVFSEAPNFNLPLATSSPELAWNDFQLFPEKQDWAQRSSFCIKRRNSTESDITSHKHTKISSRGVSTAGANVHMQKCRTSRVTREGFICIHFITKYAQGLGTSWSSYVHVHNHRYGYKHITWNRKNAFNCKHV